MDSFTFYFLQGAALAVSAAVTPGPFQTFLISRALKSGWKRTLPAALAPLVSDGPILVLVLLILSHTATYFLEILRIVGGIFILYLAKGVYRTFKESSALPASSHESAVNSLFNAIAINALNPNPYLFWSVVGGPLVLSGWRESPWVGAGFLIGFYCTFVASLAGVILLFSRASKLDRKVEKVLYLGAFLALAFFGLYQIIRGLLFWL